MKLLHPKIVAPTTKVLIIATTVRLIFRLDMSTPFFGVLELAKSPQRMQIVSSLSSPTGRKAISIPNFSVSMLIVLLSVF